MNDEATHEFQSLRRENVELKAEIERLKARHQAEDTAFATVGTLTFKAVAGRSLSHAMRNWFSYTFKEKRIPIDETADLVTAIIRRVIRVGFAGLLIALIPVTVLIWQTALLSQQNKLIQSQNKFFQEQNISIREQIELQRRGIMRQAYDRNLSKHKARIIGELAVMYGGSVQESYGNDLYSIRTADDQHYFYVQNDATGQRITLGIHLLFRPDKTVIHNQGQSLLSVMAQVLQRNISLIDKIEIQGHTDQTPSHSSRDNLDLASRRSTAVLRFLRENGINPVEKEMSATSFGEHVPLGSNSTTEGRRRNRRIEIVLTIEPEDILEKAIRNLDDALARLGPENSDD